MLHLCYCNIANVMLSLNFNDTFKFLRNIVTNKSANINLVLIEYYCCFYHAPHALSLGVSKSIQVGSFSDKTSLSSDTSETACSIVQSLEGTEW